MAVLSSAEEHLPQEWHLKGFRKGKMDGLPKVVCVTNGTSYLGLWIAINLLRRGYMVRLTVDTTEELEKLMEMEEFARYRNSVVGVVGNITAEDPDSLSEKFDGCYGVFHTSSFIDPLSVSGFTEHMVNLEVQGAEKVVEACSLASSVRRLVFTSSLAACIWHSRVIESDIRVDEKCWSDPSLCRERKLWFAQAKTMAEKAAWRVARERGGLVMVSMCPAFLTGPAFSSSNSTSSIAYFKGAKEMFEKKVLATVDVQKAAEAHVCVYQEMGEGGASGRYICFDKLIKTPTDALHLEEKLKFNMGFSQGFEDNDSIENGRFVIGTDRVVNAKLGRVMAKWCLQSNSALGIM
ncbi:cinnamoyl-CoA reductase-like SNL6 [Cryptomeria japonica]|uniref:cinnamoyl-CoA reductase-like SNL6 n=1 Tax=Cryptomeria japonica TaxID=3369 RepID=UPI0025AC03A3|nr:cinnamoyl-CoA reductase-like SNL6 [Cryptomeria japonica]